MLAGSPNRTYWTSALMTPAGLNIDNGSCSTVQGFVTGPLTQQRWAAPVRPPLQLPVLHVALR